MTVKIFRISKKIDSRSPEKLARLATRSDTDCERVLLHLRGLHGHEQVKSFVMNQVSRVPSLINKKSIKNIFLKILEEFQLQKSVEDLLDAFMHNIAANSLEKEEQKLLINLVTRYPESRVPAILMLSGSTPAVVTNKIVAQFGFSARPLANEQQKQNELTEKMLNELRSGDSWENEQSGIIYGMRLLKNKNDPVVFEFIHAAPILPESLSNAVLSFGAPTMAEELRKNSPSFATHIERVQNAHKFPEEQFNIVMSFMENPYVRKDKKLGMIDYAIAALQPIYSEKFARWISSIPDEQYFVKAMNLLREGKLRDVSLITANEPFSNLYYEQLKEILNSKGLFHNSDPSFIKAVEEEDDYNFAPVEYSF